MRFGANRPVMCLISAPDRQSQVRCRLSASWQRCSNRQARVFNMPGPESSTRSSTTPPTARAAPPRSAALARLHRLDCIEQQIGDHGFDMDALDQHRRGFRVTMVTPSVTSGWWLIDAQALAISSSSASLLFHRAVEYEVAHAPYSLRSHARSGGRYSPRSRRAAGYSRVNYSASTPVSM